MSGQKILSVKQKGGHESRSPKVSELKLRDSLVGSVRRLVRGQHSLTGPRLMSRLSSSSRPPDTRHLDTRNTHYLSSELKAYLSAVVWFSIQTVSARLSPRYLARHSADPRDHSPLSSSSPDTGHCQYRESGVWELFPATKHHNITHLPCQHSPHHQDSSGLVPQID